MSSAYQTACEALSRFVSPRAAEEVVAGSLREMGSHPRQASREQVLRALAGGALARLEAIMPPARAREAVREASRLLRDPDAAPPSPAALPAVFTPVERRRPEARSLAEVAAEDGVTAVLHSDRSGRVLDARTADLDPDLLAAVSAAASLLLARQRRCLAGPQLLHCDLGNAHAFVATRGESLYTVLAEGRVNVGRVLGDLKAIQETP
ncbi:MAG TPA: hypothetical protein VNT60_00315 [Deinococcales bacterium]|nr:hypothetical protein [Deinococcales bacterium]